MPRQADEPAKDENALATPGVSQLPGNQIGARLHHAKADDERDDKRCRIDLELLGADQRHDGSLDPDHPADEGVDQHEQGKLRPVLSQSQPDRRGGGLWSRYYVAHWIKRRQP